MVKPIRDITPSMATAIAEGHLDPSTMEAYECSLSHKVFGSAPTSEQYEVSAPEDIVESRFASSKQTRKRNMQGKLIALPFKPQKTKVQQ